MPDGSAMQAQGLDDDEAADMDAQEKFFVVGGSHVEEVGPDAQMEERPDKPSIPELY